MRVFLSSIMGVAVVGLVACGSQDSAPSRPPLQMPDSLVGPGLVAGGVTNPTPVPGATPTPTPTPGPTPTPTPAPGGNPVVRLTAKVLGVVCNNEAVPGSENMTRIPVGCRVRLDLNAKDADNKPTDPKGEPEWEFRPEELVEVTPDPFCPLLKVKEEGTLHVSASVDGVDSNDLVLTFYR
jgi:hypothetical protein